VPIILRAGIVVVLPMIVAWSTGLKLVTTSMMVGRTGFEVDCLHLEIIGQITSDQMPWE
jgi:hypothetical protein